MNLLEAPVRSTFQQRVNTRMREFHAPPPHDIWDFIMAELRRNNWVKVYGSEAKLRADMEWFLDYPPGSAIVSSEQEIDDEIRHLFTVFQPP